MQSEYLRPSTPSFAITMRPIKVTEARSIINQLRLMNLDSVDYEYVKELIGRLFVGLPMRGITPHRDSRLYRGVLYRDRPTKSSQLGYPPPSLVTGFQRCNPPQNPMFYCSPDPACVYYELNVKPGDKLYLSKWSVVKDFWLLQISPRDIEVERSHVGDMVATFFETKFTQPVPEVFTSEYKITAAIAEKMCMGNVLNDQNMILGGVSYPSVAHPSKSENLAIRTQVADTHLSLDYVEEVVVESVQEKVIQYKRTDFCSQFVDGNLAWSGTPIRWSVPPGVTYLACVEPDGWVIRDEQGRIVDPG